MRRLACGKQGRMGDRAGKRDRPPPAIGKFYLIQWYFRSFHPPSAVIAQALCQFDAVDEAGFAFLTPSY